MSWQKRRAAALGHKWAFRHSNLGRRLCCSRKHVVQPHSGTSVTVPLSHPGFHTQTPCASVIWFRSRSLTSAVKPQPRYICQSSVCSNVLANQSCSCSRAISSQNQRFKIQNIHQIHTVPSSATHTPATTRTLMHKTLTISLTKKFGASNKKIFHQVAETPHNHLNFAKGRNNTGNISPCKLLPNGSCSQLYNSRPC